MEEMNVQLSEGEKKTPKTPRAPMVGMAVMGLCILLLGVKVLKLKLVHLHRYSSAFPHTRTRTAFSSVM